VADAPGLRAQLDAWLTELRPGAVGWLGDTSGVTADGTFIAVARFESEAAARANSDRPEQGAWWEKTKATFDGDVVFTDCPDVDTFLAGGSDDAGFVQIIRGRADRSALLPMADELNAALRRLRPDVIGGTMAWPGDGTFVQTVYFSSEGAARQAESATPGSEEDQAAAEMLASLVVPERFYDLTDPWFYSA
jgi:hypothetical protein